MRKGKRIGSMEEQVYSCIGNYVTNKYLGTAVITYGPIMLPTLNIRGNLLLVERISTRTGKLRPGDVVIFRSPETPSKIFCKQLIRMEVDQSPTLSTHNSVIDDCGPRGRGWVEGDNIYNSKDSRNLGAVPYGLLKGRAFWTLLPRKDFGPLAPKPKKQFIPMIVLWVEESAR